MSEDSMATPHETHSRTMHVWSWSNAWALTRAGYTNSWQRLSATTLLLFALNGVAMLPSMVFIMRATSPAGIPLPPGEPSQLSPMFWLLITLSTLAVSLPTSIGIPMCGLAAIDGKPMLMELFRPYRRLGIVIAIYLLGQLLSAAMLAVIGGGVMLGIALTLPFFGAAHQNWIIGIPLALIVLIAALFGIAWYFRVIVRCMFVAVVACDPAFHAPGIVDCFKISWLAMKGREASVIGFMAMIAILAYLSILLLGVGFIVIGFPLVMVALGAVYRLCVEPLAAARSGDHFTQ